MIEFIRLRGVYCSTKARLFLAIALALGCVLWSASAQAQQLCITQPGNAPGDIVEAWVDFWDQGQNGFSWMMNINGVSAVPSDNYGGVQRLWGPDGQCLHECAPIRFVARTSNVYLSLDVTGGNASGWKCSYIAQVVGHQEPPVNNRKKERARVVAERFTNAEGVFMFLAIPTCVSGIGDYIPCIAALSGQFFSNRMAMVQNQIVADPWDPNFMEPYDGRDWPSDEEIGAVYGNDPYANNIVWYVKGAIVMGDFIYVESNRASSCEMANVDCSGWHRDRVNWGLSKLAQYMNGGADNLWVIAWEVEQQQGDPDLVWWLRETAQASNDAAQEYRQ